jgi:uncharacterized membrane protein
VPAAPLAADALLVILRWLHALAAVAFLGWSAVLLIDGGTPAATRRFKDVTDISLLVFLATGFVLSFDRLSHGANPVYAGVLAVKVLFAVLAFQFAFRWRRVGLQLLAPDGRVALIFGAGAVLLAAVLKEIFESGLRSAT